MVTEVHKRVHQMPVVESVSIVFPRTLHESTTYRHDCAAETGVWAMNEPIVLSWQTLIRAQSSLQSLLARNTSVSDEADKAELITSSATSFLI